MQTGTIKKIVNDRGFGFVAPDGSPRRDKGDIFFHITGLAPGTDFDRLEIGQQVEFNIADGTNDRPRAVDVRVLRD